VRCDRAFLICWSVVDVGCYKSCRSAGSRGASMRCSKCGSENPSGRKFCGECGDPFAVKCPKCGAENTAPFKFCGECDATLGVATAASTIRAEPESSAIRVNP